jgi:UDP-N-acetylglucosamine 4,6-dehydratase
MSVVRYGNVVGSRGSVVPFFLKASKTGTLPVTDTRMTRFWITLPQGVQFVRDCLARMQGGEIFVPKIPSMDIMSLAKAIAPDAKIEVVGIRPGEKLHEEMISETDALRSIDMGDHYVIKPGFEWAGNLDLEGDSLPEGFSYSSNTNSHWLSEDELRAMIRDLETS